MSELVGRLNWAVADFGFRRSGESHKLQVGEAEDKVAESLVLLKQAKHSGSPELNMAEIDEILQELSGSIDKIRKLRSDMNRNS